MRIVARRARATPTTSRSRAATTCGVDEPPDGGRHRHRPPPDPAARRQPRRLHRDHGRDVRASAKAGTSAQVEVDVEMAYEGPVPTSFEVGLKLPAELDDEQRRRLLVIATKCPVHKVLAGEAHVNVVERLEAA